MESGISTGPVEIGAAVGTSIGADGERLLGSRLIGTDGVGIGAIISPASYSASLRFALQ